jgi:acetolactate synthase-1/2/3 large subunit
VPFDKYWGDPSRCQVIQVDVDPRHIGVSRPVALGIVSEARPALEGLDAKLQVRRIASRERTDLRDMRGQYEAWVQSLGSAVEQWTGPGIHPAQVCSVVGSVFGREAVYCTDGGMTSLWAALALPSTRPSSYHSIMEFGMLGAGIPSAIGAKLGSPDREVVCVTGDGAAGFNAMELQVAAREGVKITVVVMCEGEWTMEIPNEIARYGKTFGTTMGEVRWDVVATGLGCHGEFVESLQQLPAALERATRQERPAVVCVRTSKEANLAVPRTVMDRFFEVYFGPAA